MSSAKTPGDTIPPLLFEISRAGRRAVRLPAPDVPTAELPAALLREAAPALPEVSELDVVRHFTRLSQTNMAIDTTFYPLGSCTMKYNPKVNEDVASMPGFAEHHPAAPEERSQGSLAIMCELQEMLAEIAGFAGTSLQPAAGAQGELTGILMIRAYHEARGDTGRTKILVPDSAHGTNPATVAMAGFHAVELPSDRNGNVDLAALKEVCGPDVAGLMITNPNTLGLFEEHITQVAAAVHGCGGLVYGDGANFNAILGIVRPGDLGIDVMHFNLHKTFSTPHGGGGPGAGPVGCREDLIPFLPGPIVVREKGPSSAGVAGNNGPASAGTAAAGSATHGETSATRATRPVHGETSAGETAYRFVMPERSIGRLKAFHGNFGMLLRAWVYIRMHGASGLRVISENAVLNANYLKKLVDPIFPVRFKRSCMHEFVANGGAYEGVATMDIAKRLLDFGFHSPTVYFPLIVKEALMIEPTESENRETLEAFAEALAAIAREARETPDLLYAAPHTMPRKRLDEVQAVRSLVLCYRPKTG